MSKTKRVLSIIISVLVFALVGARLAFAVTQCMEPDHADNNEQVQGPGEPEELPAVEAEQYTVRYVDDNGVHTFTVKEGETYYIDEIPERYGYEFIGLYDAESGGVAYVGADGVSLSPYNEGRDIVLFPRYVPKEYTLILDYCDETDKTERYTVRYGENISGIPTDVAFKNCEFAGWYTSPDCEGMRITDEYGIIPGHSLVHESNFDLDSGSIRLYAGYTNTVTIYAGDEVEQLTVKYGTPVDEIMPEHDTDGMLPLTWSLSLDGGTIFDGDITDNITLYAAEWAPYIMFDANGGDPVDILIARAGSEITLKNATRERCFFAGWFTADGEPFVDTVMPEESIALRAGWYNALEVSEDVPGNRILHSSTKGAENVLRNIDLHDRIPEDTVDVRVKVECVMYTEDELEQWTGGIVFKSKDSGIIVARALDNVHSAEPASFLVESDARLTDGRLYYSYYAYRIVGRLIRLPNGMIITPDSDLNINELRITVYYPDTSTLYL